MWLAIGALAMSLGVAAPSVALAKDPLMKLALSPIDQAGSFFDLTLRPGQSRRLEVRIANDGGMAIVARTYSADVYTIINGGFGGRLRDEPRTGMTGWVVYPTDVLALAPGEGILRAFTVTVPPDAGPGEYISSLVLENDQPILSQDAIGLNQIVRQALAIVVTVPGLRSPGLAIGEATHKVVAGASIIRIAVENIGNIRLKPIVGFTLLNATGSEVSRANMQMDTFYSLTSTFIEFPLAALLQPGTYSVQLTLADARQGVHTQKQLALVVDAAEQASLQDGVVPGLTGVVQGSGIGPLATAGIVLAVVFLLAIGSAVFILLARRRRRSHPRAGFLRPVHR
ncbi:MAG: hypothetical protein M3R32_06130 [Chloroflexota bacterium]|nr:hypothetical protein [Chloroflexota bacterium]